jgi:hypothetical protein
MINVGLKMFTTRSLVTFALIASILTMLVSGIVASAHVDTEKKKEATGHVYTWGP